MSFWDKFYDKTKINRLGDKSNLQDRIEQFLTDYPEEERMKYACIAGLCARVINADGIIEDSEKAGMHDIFAEWMPVNKRVIEEIINIAVDEIKDLGGLEDYKYAHQLVPLMNVEERYELLVALFALAASDQSVDNIESEEIRMITQTLKLEHKHFIAARARVIEYLKALKPS